MKCNCAIMKNCSKQEQMLWWVVLAYSYHDLIFEHEGGCVTDRSEHGELAQGRK